MAIIGATNALEPNLLQALTRTNDYLFSKYTKEYILM